MADEKESKIESLGLDEALEDLKFLAQKVSDMSKDLMQKAAEQAEGITDKMGDVVESTGDILISAGETIKSTKKMFED
jgi:archaellum component FlaC|tara:strand:+ start:18355 stop:18588 length:234 start_codon:yes stop_codon:yes gene_type:complete